MSEDNTVTTVVGDTIESSNSNNNNNGIQIDVKQQEQEQEQEKEQEQDINPPDMLRKKTTMANKECIVLAKFLERQKDQITALHDITMEHNEDTNQLVLVYNKNNKVMDIIGLNHCICVTIPQEEKYSLTLHWMPKQGKNLLGMVKKERVYDPLFMMFDNAVDFEDWKNLLINKTNNKYKIMNMLIFVNPVSGTGQTSMNILKKTTELLTSVGHTYDCIVTEYTDHAKYIMKNKDNIYDYDCILCISGDGVVNEIINGIMLRKERMEIIKKLTFGHIPAGSGNGLAKSILRTSNELYHYYNMLYLICKGVRRPLDMFVWLQEDEPEPLFGTLSLGWSLISDVDFESEYLRSTLGGLRFLPIALQRMIFLRSYNAKLSYLTKETIENNDNKNDNDNNNENNNKNDNKNDNNCCTLYNQCNDCLILDKDKDREYNELENYLNFINEEYSHLGKDNLSQYTNIWSHETNDYKVLWCMNVSDAASDMYTAPKAHLSDGYLDLVVMKGEDVGTGQILPAFLALEEGTHVDMCEYVKVKALRLEPRSNSILSIDGERSGSSNVEMRVFRGILNVFSS